jgi:hypothetical protein
VKIEVGYLKSLFAYEYGHCAECRIKTPERAISCSNHLASLQDSHKKEVAKLKRKLDAANAARQRISELATSAMGMLGQMHDATLSQQKRFRKLQQKFGLQFEFWMQHKLPHVRRKQTPTPTCTYTSTHAPPHPGPD